MKCRNCKQEISTKDIRCPHCGTSPRRNPIVSLLHGWGILDLIVLSIALSGIAAFVWVYLLGNMAKLGRTTWEVNAQAYEETAGIVKVIGSIRNISEYTQEGFVFLELRCYNEFAKLIWYETATIESNSTGPQSEIPFAFVIEKPTGFAFFNVKAHSGGSS